MEKGLIEFSNFLEPREILKDWQTAMIDMMDWQKRTLKKSVEHL